MFSIPTVVTARLPVVATRMGRRRVGIHRVAARREARLDRSRAVQRRAFGHPDARARTIRRRGLRQSMTPDAPISRKRARMRFAASSIAFPSGDASTCANDNSFGELIG